MLINKSNIFAQIDNDYNKGFEFDAEKIRKLINQLKQKFTEEKILHYLVQKTQVNSTDNLPIKYTFPLLFISIDVLKQNITMIIEALPKKHLDFLLSYFNAEIIYLLLSEYLKQEWDKFLTNKNHSASFDDVFNLIIKHTKKLIKLNMKDQKSSDIDESQEVIAEVILYILNNDSLNKEYYLEKMLPLIKHKKQSTNMQKVYRKVFLNNFSDEIFKWLCKDVNYFSDETSDIFINRIMQMSPSNKTDSDDSIISLLFYFSDYVQFFSNHSQTINFSSLSKILNNRIEQRLLIEAMVDLELKDYGSVIYEFVRQSIVSIEVKNFSRYSEKEAKFLLKATRYLKDTPLFNRLITTAKINSVHLTYERNIDANKYKFFVYILFYGIDDVKLAHQLVKEIFLSTYRESAINIIINNMRLFSEEMKEEIILAKLEKILTNKNTVNVNIAIRLVPFLSAKKHKSLFYKLLELNDERLSSMCHDVIVNQTFENIE